MAYSPDLAHFDFQAFPGLHDFLEGQWYHDVKSLKKAVTNFFWKEVPGMVWYQQTHQKLGDNPENKVFFGLRSIC